MHLIKWLYPGLGFKRWLFVFAVGTLCVGLGAALIFNYKYIDSIEEAIFRFVYTWQGSYDYGFTAIAGGLIALLGSGLMLLATRHIIRSVITALMPEGTSARLVDLVYTEVLKILPPRAMEKKIRTTEAVQQIKG